MNAVAAELTKPEAIHLIGEDGDICCGFDQDWYGTHWRRMAGCGPTVAATILLYLHRVRGVALPIEIRDRAGCVRLMDEVWRHVTPTVRGVDRTDILACGVTAFANAHGAALISRTLEVPGREKDRPGLADVCAFLSDGLRRDCPVAFLNLSNGKVRNLDDWHWVTVVSLRAGEGGQAASVRVYDGAKALEIDLKLWLETTTLGGGFVYFIKRDEEKRSDNAV